MATGVNKFIGLGNLGRPAELRYTKDGAAVASFSVACTESWKGQDGAAQERTEWVKCVYWGKAAEAVAEYLTKGKQVYVEGRLQTRKWTDKDGNERYTTEVRVDRLQLLGGGHRRDAEGREDPAAATTANGDEFDDQF